MTKRKGGLRRKSRSKYTKNFRQKGKIPLVRYLQLFSEGDKVMLVVEPAVQKGMYNSRFIGRAGTVIRRSGKCYEVAISDSGKEKMLIVHPVHLKRIENVNS
jgi:ribosomal protein L21E